MDYSIRAKLKIYLRGAFYYLGKFEYTTERKESESVRTTEMKGAGFERPAQVAIFYLNCPVENPYDIP